MAEHPKYIGPRLLRIAVSVLLLVYVLREVDLPAALQLLKNSNVQMFVLMVAVYVGSKVLSAYRLQVLVRYGQPDVALWPMIEITFLSNFLAIFLPGGGGEVVRIAALKRHGLRLAQSFSSVVLDRLLGFGALGMMLLAVAPFASDIGFPTGVQPAIIGLSLILLIAFVGMHPAFHRFLQRFSPGGSRRAKAVSALMEIVDQYRANPGALVWAVTLALLMQLVRVVFFYLGVLTLDVPVSFLSMFILVPAFVLLTSLPVSIGGVGVREALFLAFFTALSVQKDAAVALALLLYFANFLASLPGAWVLLRLKLSVRKVEQRG
jgi:uncharacterized protein (TIRG00374 family)